VFGFVSQQTLSLDSDDDLHIGCQNVWDNHWQQSSLKLYPPIWSHNTIDWTLPLIRIYTCALLQKYCTCFTYLLPKRCLVIEIKKAAICRQQRHLSVQADGNELNLYLLMIIISANLSGKIVFYTITTAQNMWSESKKHFNIYWWTVYDQLSTWHNWILHVTNSLAVNDNSYTKCSLFVVVIDLNKIIYIFLRHVNCGFSMK